MESPTPLQLVHPAMPCRAAHDACVSPVGWVTSPSAFYAVVVCDVCSIRVDGLAWNGGDGRISLRCIQLQFGIAMGTTNKEKREERGRRKQQDGEGTGNRGGRHMRVIFALL